MVAVRSLPGQTPYTQAHALMLELLDQRIQGAIPDTLLFVEHTPVVTRGRGLQQAQGQGIAFGDSARHAPLAAPLPEGVECIDVERGGDLTYHGPGQLVIYPIVHLPQRDIRAFLRHLEFRVSAVLSQWGVPTRSDPNATGVWVGEKKLASIGIAVRKWVTFHGMGLNLKTDLSHFRWITPCGFSPEVMTNLAELSLEYPRIPPEAFERTLWEREWVEHWGATRSALD